MKAIMPLLAIVIAIMLPSQAMADYCTVKPLSIIVQGDGKLYFTTDVICTDWCLINPNWTDAQKDRAMSLFVTAISQSKPLTFYFDAAGCGKLPVYTQPQTVAFTRQ